MPDRAMELRHLSQANRHIREGEQRVLAMKATIVRAELMKMNTHLARASHDLMVEVLANFKAHRLLILQALGDLDRRHSATHEAQSVS